MSPPTKRIDYVGKPIEELNPGRYTLTVVRTGIEPIYPFTTETKSFTARVWGLAYGALYGPDVDDVDRWQQFAVEFVDKLRLSTD